MFKQAFKNNFFLTKEFADFCSKITGIKYKKLGNYYILKNRNISISNYDGIERTGFQRNNISYMAVLPELNNGSIMEYSLFNKKSYASAYKNYKKSFRKHLNQGRKYNYKTEIIRKLDKNLLNQIYPIYVKQMKRHNSAIFSKSFFIEFMKLPSLLFLIKLNNEIAAYSFCFKNKDNLYTSIGGGNPKYFKNRCVNILYDERIKYACKNKLNIHSGIGTKNSGYNKFKEDAGILNYKTERYPDDTKLIKKALKLTKFKIFGLFLIIFSKLFPKKVIYRIIPFS